MQNYYLSGFTVELWGDCPCVASHNMFICIVVHNAQLLRPRDDEYWSVLTVRQCGRACRCPTNSSPSATEELMTEITCYSLEWQPLNARPRITHEKGCNMVCSRVSAEWDEWGYSFWKGNPSEDKSCLCLSQKSCTWTHTASTTSERPTILCVPCVRGRRYLSVTQGGGNLFSQRETGRYTNHDNAAFSHPFC